MMKVKVKKGCTIYHKGKKYSEENEVELSEASALIHGQNVEVVKPPRKSKVEQKPPPKLDLEPEPTPEPS